MTEFRFIAAIIVLCVVLGVGTFALSPSTGHEPSPKVYASAMALLLGALALGAFLAAGIYFGLVPFLQ